VNTKLVLRKRYHVTQEVNVEYIVNIMICSSNQIYNFTSYRVYWLSCM